jgi:hypothetical protein
MYNFALDSWIVSSLRVFMFYKVCCCGGLAKTDQEKKSSNGRDQVGDDLRTIGAKSQGIEPAARHWISKEQTLPKYQIPNTKYQNLH